MNIITDDELKHLIVEAKREAMNLVAVEVLRSVRLHTPIRPHNDSLSEYGEGARDAMKGFLTTFKRELDRVRKIALNPKKVRLNIPENISERGSIQ